MDSDFFHSNDPEPHIGRTKNIIKKYPEIKQLMGRNRNTIFYITGIVLLQIALAIFLHDKSWWWVVITAYVVGAFCNHALFVLIHECTHNLVFKSRLANMWAGMFCDLPNAF
ncbi:MAG TPA: hypothetical protein PK147_11865, partial [Saprospiraceae bacterium]|nr:hypothetical protein [Saprospiraceae bacterium]